MTAKRLQQQSLDGVSLLSLINSCLRGKFLEIGQNFEAFREQSLHTLYFSRFFVKRGKSALSSRRLESFTNACNL